MLYAYAQLRALLRHLEPVFWAFVFVVLVATWFFVRRIPGWLRSVYAASWPLVEGKIEDVSVNTFADQSLGQLAYSYLVEGERYAGYFSRQFADEQDAWDYVRPLKGQSMFVRYKGAAPEVSAVRMADQNPPFAPAQPNFLMRLLSRSLLQLVGASDWNLSSWFGTRNWPLSKGRIESGSVTVKRERGFWYLVTYYVCEIGYSYSVGNEYYSGHFESSFLREKAAQEFTEAWKGKEVFVRYYPDSPGISSLRRQDQQELLGQQVKGL